MGAATASPASAQCSPDPTEANGITTCSGIDEDGLVVATPGTQVNVEADAIVRPGSAAAAISMVSPFADLFVQGLVDGISKPGIAVIAGPPQFTTTPPGPCDPYAGASLRPCLPPGTIQRFDPFVNATISVAAGGTVTGSQALLLSRDANNMGSFSVRLVNAGTLTGTAGPAILNDIALNGYLAFTNEATGSIDGGANAAIATMTSGTGISNFGRITATGPGATVSGSGALSITNAAGATLGGSVTAISAGGALTLTNAGTISGSVISSAAAGENSIVDTRQGTIGGDLVLGAGNDTLLALFDTTTGRISSITGAVDGGAGTDTIAIGIEGDATLGATPLPTNFERLGLDLIDDARVTLAPGFTMIGGIALSGNGSVFNQADLVTSGAAVTSNGGGLPLSFTNSANITAALAADQVAVSISTDLTNSGTISANGGDGARAGRTLANSGTITADGTAALAYGTLANIGMIRSTGSTGAQIYSPNVFAASTNSGSITGATTGVNLSSARLVNTGTISGGTTGVELGYFARLVNEASGIVTGGTNGVLGTGLEGKVVNAGTINGQVSFVRDFAFDSSKDIFVDAGGTVNGAIRLGGGDDQLVVDIAAIAGRPLAGATGGVDAGDGYDTLRYLINADSSAALSLTNGFEGLAYELDNNAALTLNAADPITTTIGLTGNGSVTIDGTVSASDRTLVDATIPTTDQLVNGIAGPIQDLTIINNGTLNLAATDGFGYSALAAINAGTADVTNAGMIAVSNAAGINYPAGGIFGGKTVTNTGTILLNGGGIGIYYSGAVINTGSISDTSGSNATGISSFTSLANSGTIRVDGNAVAGGFSATRITNSGIIESRQATGIQLGSNSVLINEATGTISGVTAVALSGGSVLNRGTIVGDVAAYEFSYGSSVYVSDGGSLAGNLTFGAARDRFVMTGAQTGVSGSIDGGAGDDELGWVLNASASVSLDGDPQFVSFEDALVQATGSDTVLTITATDPFAGNLYAGGDGAVVNTATIAGAVTTGHPDFASEVLPSLDFTLATFDNQGTISGGVSGAIASFVNSGTITAGSDYYGVNLVNDGAASFSNSGRIDTAVLLARSPTLEIVNSGVITGNGFSALTLDLQGGASPRTVNLVNSGTISASLVGNSMVSGTRAVILSSDGAASAVITNAENGTISADGADGLGLIAYNTALTLDNAGTISGGTVDTDGSVTGAAILSRGTLANTIRNTGLIAGAVLLLGAGDDRVENSGTITGPVFLGEGNDVFVHRTGATLGQIVAGGAGSDVFIVDAAGDGSLDASQLTGFEQLTQTGTGTFNYAGKFEVDTIALASGTLAIAAGQTLTAAGPTTITGGEAGSAVNNAGTILGGITLGSGADSVFNTGTIGGPVRLGAGNDSYTEGLASTAAGVDGGEGVDLYRVALAGDRSGIGARSNFEQLALDGTGMLTLTLDQDFQSVALAGTSLTAALNGFTIGRIDGSAAAEQVVLDSDVAALSLNGGDDALALGMANAAGQYDGGQGTDILRFTNAGPVTLSGTATAFERVSLTGGELHVAGTLGSAGNALAFADGEQSLTIASGGALAGIIDLGAGDDIFRIAAGGTLAGTVAGGAGNDVTTLDLSQDMTLSGTLTEFEQLVGEGAGALTLSGSAFSFNSVAIAGDLTIATDASLATSQLSLGSAGTLVTIAGGFSGSIAGGAGNDRIDVSGGSAAGPVAFNSISGIEALQMNAGLATIAGSAAFDSLTLTGGRLIGLGGSTITASTVDVGAGATFGSAGTVNGDIAVSGTLSPGASPGTMTVNGDVALAGSSVSLFEITPSATDKLLVNGALSIAQGATLQLVTSQSMTPGQSLDLIVASEGITGSYTNVVKPADLFGFIVQDASRISLLGQFLNDSAFAPQVQRSIDYVNLVLTSGRGSAALLAAVPQLVDASGASNQAAFAQLAPEAYASASQITVEQGIELAELGRGNAFATRRDTPGLFTFASALANTRELESAAQGTSRAQTDGYGLLGGIGWGSTAWSIGAFVGYMNNTQDLAARGARTESDGVVAGVHARWASGGLDLKAMIAFDGSDAVTRRALVDGSATGEYELQGWVSDVSIGYAMPLRNSWTIRPSLGVTAIRVTRENVAETGDSALALVVARERHHAVFADTALTLAGGARPDATIRPYLSVGLRYRLDGEAPYALAALDGGDYGLAAMGASRSPLTATATLGSDVALSQRLTVFGALSGETGEANHHASAHAGLRLAF